MSKFEEYQQKKKQNQDMDAFYASRVQEQLDKEKVPYLNFQDRNDFEDTLDKRLQNTTFAERTEYYFQNTELMKQKVVRYYQLSGDSSDPEENRFAEVEAYARKYRDGHWAHKRKSAAMNAAIKFNKAVELQEQLKKAVNLTPYQLFEKREKIMRMRLDGMLEAAKVKSQNSVHEKFLMSKAKVSCLTIISDQLDNLWVEAERTEDANQRKKFLKKQKEIENELMMARLSLRENAGSFEEKWLSKNKSRIEVKKPAKTKKGSSKKSLLPALSKEGEEIQRELYLLNRDAMYTEFPKRVQLKDRDGSPISNRDIEAREWNQKYAQAEDDGDADAQKAMIMEEIKLMMEYPLPSATEVRRKGVIHFLKKDIHGFYRMIKKTAPGIHKLASAKNQNLSEDAGIKADMFKYLENKPDIMTKAGAFMTLGEMLDEELRVKYMLEKDEDGYFQYKPRLKKELFNGEYLDDYADQLSFLAEQEETEFEQEDPVELTLEQERVKLLKINGNLNDDMHDLYRKINKTVVTKNTPKKLAKEALKDLPGLFKNFRFPSVDDINNRNFIEESLGANAGAFLGMLGKAKALFETAQDNADLKTYENDHPEFTAQLNSAAHLADVCRNYLRFFYSIDAGTYLNKCDMLRPLSNAQRVPLAQMTLLSGQKYALWKENMDAWKRDEDNLKSEKEYDDQLREESKGKKVKYFNYEYYRLAKESNRVVFHPVFRARIRNAKAKQLLGEYKAFKIEKYFNIYDTAGAMLKSVKYNDDFTPATYEDQIKHEWNDRWTKAIEDGDVKTIASMSMEGLPDIFSMELPNIDDIRFHGWIQNNLKKNPMRFFETFRRASGLLSLALEVPKLGKFLHERPALVKKLELLNSLSICVNDYMNGVLEAGFDFRVNEKNRVKKERTLVSHMKAKKVHPVLGVAEDAYMKSMWDYSSEFSNEYYDIHQADKKTRAYEKELREKKDVFLPEMEKKKEKELPDFDVSPIEKEEEPLFEDDKQELEGLEKMDSDNVGDDFLNSIEDFEEKEEGHEKIEPLKWYSQEILREVGQDESMEEEEPHIINTQHEDLRTEQQTREEEEARKAQELQKAQEKNNLEIIEEEEKEEEKEEDKKEKKSTDNIIMEKEDLRTFRQIKEEEKARKSADYNMDDKVKSYPPRQLRYTKAYIKDAGTIRKKYEKQAYASNDCWSCAGPAILNHMLHKEKGYKYVTQEQFRGFEPKFLKASEMGLEKEEDAEAQKVEIMTFTTLNDNVDREDSPIGNPYLIADFYFQKLEKYPAHKNTAVRKVLFQVKKAVDHRNGIVYLKDKKGNVIGKKKIDRNLAAVHNLQQHFRDTVTAAINKDEAIAMYYHGHYYVITGINGDTLEVCDSLKKYASKTLDIKDVIGNTQNSDPLQRPVELVWLDKIDDPKELTKEFKDLKFDEKTGVFSTDQQKFSDNVAHVLGVDVAKEPEECQEDVSSYVEERIYVPKSFDKTVNKAVKK